MKNRENCCPAGSRRLKMCSAMGAVLAFSGIEGAAPLLHGRSSCARSLGACLSKHFREQVDIVSTHYDVQTSFSEENEGLRHAVERIAKKFSPRLVGVLPSCQTGRGHAEANAIIDRLRPVAGGVDLVYADLPLYPSTYIDGFHLAVRTIVEYFSPPLLAGRQKMKKTADVNLFPGILSNEDLRHLKEIFEDFKVGLVLLPDYSERLEGPSWVAPETLRPGGTPIGSIQKMYLASASAEFGSVLESPGTHQGRTAGAFLERGFGVPCTRIDIPIGLKATDAFFQHMKMMTGKPVPEKYVRQKQRLEDSYVDGNRYVSQKKAIVFGEENFVISLAGFLAEIGIIPVLCASDGKSGVFREVLMSYLPENIRKKTGVHVNLNFEQIFEKAVQLKPDLMVGSSLGAHMARHLRIPLIRAGFPILDRLCGTRILHVGYQGAQQLFDNIVNSMIREEQEVA